MANWRERLGRRLRARFRPAAVDREMDDEIRLHIALETEELIRSEGLSPEEARRRALAAFGGVERYRAAHRDARGFVWADMLGRDLRHAVRSLRRSPGFVLVSTLTLGLALGLGVTTYAMLDAVWHPYTPVKDAGHVYSVRMWGGGLSEHVRGWDQYARLRDQGRFYQAISFVLPNSFQFALAGGSFELTRINYAGPGLFDLLGIKPVRGRLFSANPRAVEDEGAALVSEEFWRQRLHGRPLTGTTVTWQDRIFMVVGVLPRGDWQMSAADVWVRAPFSLETAPRTPTMMPFVRLRAGVKEAVAQRQADTVAAGLAQEFGTGHFPWAYRLMSMKPKPRPIGTLHKALALAALLILLIGCGNLANLMLVRGATRTRELALRTAVGASRWALVRLLLAEAVIVAVLGALVGGVLAEWGTSLLRHQVPSGIAGFGLLVPYLSWRAFWFGAAATGMTVVLFGLLPALRASNVKVNEPLKGAAGTTTGRHRRDFYFLAAGEAALALAVMMAALLLTKAADRVAAYPFGYDIDNLWTAWLIFSPDTTSAESRSRLPDELLARAEKTDGVLSAALLWSRTQGVAIGDDVAGRRFGGRTYSNAFPIVSPGFLRTLGIPVVSGRDFADGDQYGTGAVIVDEAAANSLWPGDEPVGHMLKVGSWSSTAPWRPVIGVVRNTRLGFVSDPYEQRDPGVYVVPGPSETRSTRFVQLVFRTRADSGATVLSVRRALQSPFVRNAFVLPWTRQFDDVVSGRWFVAAVFLAFSLFALGLAVVGLYGVLAYAASQRRREFGVRIALGARAADLGKLVLHDMLVMVLAGTAVGGFFSMWGSRFLGTWLYDVPQTDAAALVTAEAALFVVAMLAALGPVLGAMRVSPLEILRAT